MKRELIGHLFWFCFVYLFCLVSFFVYPAFFRSETAVPQWWVPDVDKRLRAQSSRLPSLPKTSDTNYKEDAKLQSLKEQPPQGYPHLRSSEVPRAILISDRLATNLGAPMSTLSLLEVWFYYSKMVQIIARDAENKV